MLSEAQMREFYQRGYILLPQLFEQSDIDKIKLAFDRLYKQAEQLFKTEVVDGTQFVVQDDQIRRAVWVGAAEPELLEISEHQKLLQPVSQILGSDEMIQLINQAHFKMPGDKVNFHWHQDSDHRRYGTELWKDINGKGSYVQTVVAIDPITHENGPLQFIPGSPRFGHIGSDLQLNQSKYFSEDEIETVVMRPGDAVFFGPYTIHGSAPNESSTPRRVFINGFAYPGANKREYPGEGSCRPLKLLNCA